MGRKEIKSNKQNQTKQNYFVFLKLRKVTYLCVQFILQNHKILLTQAVEDGDLISVKEMLYYESVLEKGLETCMADCRCSVS